MKSKSNEITSAAYEQFKKVKKIHAVTYKDICERLKDIGIDISPKNLAVKVSSRILSLELYIAVFIVMGESSINIEAIGQEVKK